MERRDYPLGAARCVVEIEGRAARVVLTGDLDLQTSGLFADAMARLDVDEVVVDLRDVTFFDAAALSAFEALQRRLGGYRRVAEAGKRGLVLVAPSRAVTRVMDIAAVRSVFNIVE